MNDALKDPMVLRSIIMDHYEYPRNHTLSDDATYLQKHMPVNLVLTISMYRHSLKMAKSRIFVSMALLVRFQLPLLLS